MRIARLQTPQGPRPVVWREGGWVEVDTIWELPAAHFGAGHDPAGAVLLAPVQPRVILGMLHNGGAADRQIPPQAFQKSSHTAVGPDAAILVDPSTGTVKGEGELTLVVGRTARKLTMDNALDHVLGWTIGNDVTAFDQIPLDDKLLQAKNGDGFTPLGPWIETEVDWRAAPIEVRVDGVVTNTSSSANLARNALEVFCYVTEHLTLHPGDVILTGAPNTATVILPGQVMEITIEPIGTLSNPVREL